MLFLLYLQRLYDQKQNTNVRNVTGIARGVFSSLFCQVLTATFEENCLETIKCSIRKVTIILHALR